MCIHYIAQMYVCVPRACLVLRSGFRFHGTGITEGSELPWVCWEPNPGPLQEQVFLATKPPLQLLLYESHRVRAGFSTDCQCL